MPAIHGTVSRYNSGCRCQACRDAINALHRAYRAEQKAQAAACEGSALEDLELPDVGSSDPVYPDLDTDNEIRELTLAVEELRSLRLIPLTERLAHPPRPASAFSRPALVPSTRQARRPMFGARPIARAPARPTADGWTDELATAYRLYLAGIGPSPSLLALREATARRRPF